MNIRPAQEPLAQLAVDVLIVGVGPSLDGPLAALDERFDKKLIAELRARKFKGGDGACQVIPSLGRLAARTLVVVGIGDGSWPALRVAAGRAGREARNLGATTAGLAFPGDAETTVRLLEAASAGNYLFQLYKPEEERSPAVATWFVASDAPAGSALQQASSRTKWQSWARDLVNLPPADLYPTSLAARARELQAIPGVEVEVWDFDKCKAEGCVGIVAVGQGSDRTGLLIHVRYRPDGASKDHIALVGKGVTFDSGGLSLKPSDGMQTMRCDMGGAATMLAATAIAAEAKIPVSIDTFCPAVENMVSGNSYKLGDILRYTNGVTVEIHNTDAEGRLILADGLIRAAQVKGVSTIIDAATLTGACVVALGDDYTGMFTDDDALAGELLAAAGHTGEGLWRMPLHGPYKEMLKSDYAQIKNVGGRPAGAITAGLFLQYFVSGVRWAHLDIAGPAFMDKPTSRYAAGGTGEMVRTLATWMARRGA